VHEGAHLPHGTFGAHTSAIMRNVFAARHAGVPTARPLHHHFFLTTTQLQNTQMADGHADRITTLAQLLCEATPGKINDACVHIGPHTYNLLGLLMYTLYLSFEFDIQMIQHMIEQSLCMGADPNVNMYFEEDGHTFYTIYEFALMLSKLKLYSIDIMDSLLKQFEAAGGVVRPQAFPEIAYKASTMQELASPI
jgi:hypothetical protein